MTPGGPIDRMTAAVQAVAPKRAWLRQISPVLPPPFALVEMSLLVAVIVLEYLWEGFPALTRINPHPYWIAVLLLSLQYGTVSGLIAASIAIIGTVLIGMPDPDIEERYFNYLVRVWTQPVLWLLVALLLGTFRARQIEQRDELLRQAENLRMRGTTLLDHTNNLRTRCTMLERRLATREATDTPQLLAALARLSDAEPGRWASALAATLSAGFPRSQISLYAVDGGSVRLVLLHDQITTPQGAASQTPGPLAPAEIESGHALLATVIGQGRSASVLDASDDVALRGLGVAAVPIFSGPVNVAGSRVIGLLKADVLPPDQIDAMTTRRLAVVAQQLAPALQRGLVSAVADAGARPVRGGVLPMIEDAIPTVRKWRLLRGLPGGRVEAPSPADGRDG